MTANDSKSYLGSLNKSVGEYNNSYHCSIGIKPTYVEYFVFPELFQLGHEAPEFKIGELDIYNLFNVQRCLNNLKTKVDDLDVDKFKTVPIDL